MWDLFSRDTEYLGNEIRYQETESAIEPRPKVVDILVSFCNFVFLRKQKTKKLPAFEVQYLCKKAMLANKI